jgi:Protein of unknown function (DUF2510)
MEIVGVKRAHGIAALFLLGVGIGTGIFYATQMTQTLDSCDNGTLSQQTNAAAVEQCTAAGGHNFWGFVIAVICAVLVGVVVKKTNWHSKPPIQFQPATPSVPPTLLPALPPAGWYQDPGNAADRRWWNGSAWGISATEIDPYQPYVSGST